MGQTANELSVMSVESVAYINREAALPTGCVLVIYKQLLHKGSTPYNADGDLPNVFTGVLFREDELDNPTAKRIRREISWGQLTFSAFGLAEDVKRVEVKLNEQSLRRPTMASSVTNYVTKNHKFGTIKTGVNKRGKDEGYTYLESEYMAYRIGQRRTYVTASYETSNGIDYDVCLNAEGTVRLDPRNMPDLEAIEVLPEWVEAAKSVVDKKHDAKRIAELKKQFSK